VKKDAIVKVARVIGRGIVAVVKLVKKKRPEKSP
jgi:hypothetical protein